MAKERRRGKNEGSIFLRNDGLFVGTLTIGYDENGKRKRKTVYGKTKEEARKKLFQLQMSVAQGTVVEAKRQTVAQYMHEWLEGTVKPNKRLSTYVCYSNIVRNHINPQIGGIVLASLKPAHIEHLYSSLTLARNFKSDKKLSPRMRELTHAVLRKALQSAYQSQKIPKNYCDLVERPTAARPTMKYLTQAEVMKLLALSVGDRLHALYVLAVATGMRQGELLGLQWRQVDFSTGSVSVVHTLLEHQGCFELGEPKTNKGRRLVRLPKFATEALRKHRQQMEAEGHTGPWVFCDPSGSPISKSYLRRRSFLPLLERAGLPKIRFHDLRHTAATLHLIQGTHPKVVQEILGHSVIALTLDTYSHLIPSMQQQAAAKLDEVFAAFGA